MSVKERILAIRLMERISDNPEYAKAFGIEVGNGPGDMGAKTPSTAAE